MADPFGRALRDHHRGEQNAPLVQRDGDETREHPVEAFYFGEYAPDPDSAVDRCLDAEFEGPLLDVGAGVGRHARYFQERFETVAIEVSEHLVETMRERGVEDARHVDMFALREEFERDRFRSVLVNGTQLCLAGSIPGLRAFLGDLAHVTASDATAVVDSYDPGHDAAADLLGYRGDPAPGLASRAFQFEYDGETGRPLVFRLFGPDRLREAAVGTGWAVAEVFRRPGDDSCHYHAALVKR